uniref:F-box domain-containing protein n=1 Tax=Ditylenchus dipsaci TaxID=166011 RepID=A0A915DGV2_9BILA
MLLDIDILAETFKYLSRKDLAFIQTTNQIFNTLIETTANPLHVIQEIDFSTKYFYSTKAATSSHFKLTRSILGLASKIRRTLIGAREKTILQESIVYINFRFYQTLNDFLVCAKAPPYLRFRLVQLDPMDGFDKHYLDGIAHFKSAFGGAQLRIRMDQPHCKHEDELLRNFKDLITTISPTFELISGCMLWWFAFEELYEALTPAPYGNQEDILSIPLIRNCRTLEILVQRYVDRLGIATYDQICDWLEAEANFTRYLQLYTNQQNKDIIALIQLLRKRFMNAQKPCSFVLETHWMSYSKNVKLFLTFENDKQAVFKLMRYGRDYESDANHFYFGDFERHNADIATFQMDSRKDLAFIQTTNQIFNTLIETSANPLHVIQEIDFSTKYFYSTKAATSSHFKLTRSILGLASKIRRTLIGGREKTILQESIVYINCRFYQTLDDFLVCEKAPSYLRFRLVQLEPMDGFDKHYLDGIAHFKRAFEGAQLRIRIDQPHCKHEDELLRNFKDFITTISPTFELISGCMLCWFAFEESYEPLTPAPYGNQEDILSIPLIRNCRTLEIMVQRYVDRLGIATYDQICDWLEAEADFTRYLQLYTNQQNKDIVALIQLLRKRFKNAQKPCSFVLETHWMSYSKDVPLEFLAPLKNQQRSEELVLELNQNPKSGSDHFFFIRRHLE